MPLTCLTDLRRRLGSLLGQAPFTQKHHRKAAAGFRRPAPPRSWRSSAADWFPAMVLISSTTSPIRAAAFDNSPTRSLVVRADRRPRRPSARLLYLAADSLTTKAILPQRRPPTALLVEASSEAAATMRGELLRALRGRGEVVRRLQVRSRPRTRFDDLADGGSKLSASLIMSALRRLGLLLLVLRLPRRAGRSVSIMVS